jgi:hypothetical protein
VSAPVGRHDCPRAPETKPRPNLDSAEIATSAPKLAVHLAFGLGELTATAEALAAAHAAGVQILSVVLRHLSCDWGDVDTASGAANDHALAAGGGLRSSYRLAGFDDALVVTTDAARGHTTAKLASQRRTDD